MIPIFWLSLWLQMSAPQQIVKFPCPEKGTVGIYLGNDSAVSNDEVTGYDCPFKVRGKGGSRTITNVTINGIHYESCETVKGYTKCKLQSAKKESSWGSEANGGDGADREHFLIHQFAEASQRAADETDGKLQVDPGKPYPSDHNQFPEVKMCGGDPPHPCDEPPVERVDVPAVQEPTREPPDCRMDAFTGGEYNGWHIPSRWNDMCTSEKPLATTCADKSRILEHDENSPPKYWCRKVEF